MSFSNTRATSYVETDIKVDSLSEFDVSLMLNEASNDQDAIYIRVPLVADAPKQRAGFFGTIYSWFMMKVGHVLDET